MSDNTNSTTQGAGVPILNDSEHAAVHATDKGKGKAPAAEDVSMDEEDSSSDEEAPAAEEEPEEADEDNMEEIDESNIITGGRRTRGKAIDFAKAAEGLDDEDDEDDDDDFEDPDQMNE